MAAVVGLGIGLLAIRKIVDMGFLSLLGRPFSPLTDWGYLRSAVGLLRHSAGTYRTVAAVVGAVLLLVAVVVVVAQSVLRLSRFTTQHRASSAWTLCGAPGLRTKVSR